MSAEKIKRLGKLKFAAVNMGAISGKTFDQVFEQNKEFVDFTVQSMSHGCGIFKFWIDYIKERKSKHA